MIFSNMFTFILFILIAVYGIPLIPFLNTALFDVYISIAAAFMLWAISSAYTVRVSKLSETGIHGLEAHLYARHVTRADYIKPLLKGHYLIGVIVLANLATPTILVSTYKLGAHLKPLGSISTQRELRLRDIGGCNDTVCIITSDVIIGNASREIIITGESRYASADGDTYVMPKTPSWDVFEGHSQGFVKIEGKHVLSEAFTPVCNITEGDLATSKIVNNSVWFDDPKLAVLYVNVSLQDNTLVHVVQSTIRTDTADMSFSCLITMDARYCDVTWSFTEKGFS